MFFLKACPKCHGDLYLDSDSYGTFIECLQCGLLRDLADQQIGRAERLISISSPLPASPYSLTVSA